jgi:hypothetical protein
MELLREAKFYQLSGLVALLERNIKKLEHEYKLGTRKNQLQSKQLSFV